MDGRPLSTPEFNQFVEPLVYPMFVVTTSDGAERSGCLVGFTTQTSIDPPRFLVCLSEKNHTTGVAQRAELIAVHVLDEEQQHELAQLFGGKSGDELDKFAHVEWRPGPGGVPVLEGCPVHFVGRVLERSPMGDHIGFLVEPIAVDVDADDGAQPMMLDDVQDVDPGHSA